MTELLPPVLPNARVLPVSNPPVVAMHQWHSTVADYAHDVYYAVLMNLDPTSTPEEVNRLLDEAHELVNKAAEGSLTYVDGSDEVIKPGPEVLPAADKVKSQQDGATFAIRRFHDDGDLFAATHELTSARMGASL